MPVAGGAPSSACSRRAPGSAYSRRGSRQWARNLLHQQQALRKPLFFCKNNAEEKLFSPCGYCSANKVTPVAGVWWKLVQVVATAAGATNGTHSQSHQHPIYLSSTIEQAGRKAFHQHGFR